MFPVDSFSAQYFEEREAAEEAKRLARLQQQHATAQTSPRPNNLSSVFSQRPEMSRPSSSSVLGNIFQGFVRATSQPPSERSCASGTSTPCQTPPAKVMTQADIEAAMTAERKKDADIVSFRAW
ncbi:hypothetical protein PRZ48_006963 [Zasmidium cellare]|uniref:Uncharacterized protein n=1 Tax=Zasmidium cellare TaxID=395010 RepID=A0ABR0EI21_ZASCE|nr:hypothetical protein PRZ48_006963 [Zasmidium cellare]